MGKAVMGLCLMVEGLRRVLYLRVEGLRRVLWMESWSCSQEHRCRGRARLAGWLGEGGWQLGIDQDRAYNVSKLGLNII